MGFLDKIFKPKWQHEDWRVREEAVKKLDDQKILIEIAKNDSSASVREEALKNISDKSVALDIVKNEPNVNVRIAIYKQHRFDFKLADIAMNHSDKYVRQSAVRAINSEKIKMEIAINGPDNDTCFTALLGITNPYDLGCIAVCANDSIIRIRARSRLKVGRNKWEVKWHMDNARDKEFSRVEKIKDNLMLADIVENHGDVQVRIKALNKIDDEAILAEIAKGNSYSDVRIIAVYKIDDEAILADIAENDSDKNVRTEAIGRITSLDKGLICLDCGKTVKNIAVDVHKKCPHCGGTSFKPNE